MPLSNAIIYIIKSNISNKAYIGSTCCPLGARLSRHEYQYRKFCDGSYNTYVTAYNIIHEGNYSASILENYPCDTTTQLHDREKWWLQNPPDNVELVNDVSTCPPHIIKAVRNEQSRLHMFNRYNNDTNYKLHKRNYYQLNKDRLKQASLARYYKNKNNNNNNNNNPSNKTKNINTDVYDYLEKRKLKNIQKSLMKELLKKSLSS